MSFNKASKSPMKKSQSKTAIQKQSKKKRSMAKSKLEGAQERTLKHEVVWCPANTVDSRMAVVVYLVSRAATTHTLVFLSDTKYENVLLKALSTAGISCARLSNPKDEASLRDFNNGSTAVLLVTDCSIKKNQLSKLNRVIQLHIAKSGSKYSERMGKVVSGGQQEVVCSTVMAQEDKPLLKDILLHTKYDFTQRTILGDVLKEIEKEIKELQRKPEAEEPTATAAETSSDTQLKTSTAKVPQVNKFFLQIDKKFTGENPLQKHSSSEKTKRKRKQRKLKLKELKAAQQQQQSKKRKTSSGNEDSDDDDDDDGSESYDDDSSDDENSRPPPRKQARGMKGRAAPVTAPKKKRSFTAALTNVSAKGVKKYRNALTYQEKKDYQNSAITGPE